jgi:hypothetical protein
MDGFQVKFDETHSYDLEVMLSYEVSGLGVIVLFSLWSRG